MNQSDATPRIENVLLQHPVIASVKNDEDVAAVLDTACPVIFVLFGSIITVPRIVETLKSAGRTVFVDVDLIDGFSNRTVAVDFLKQHTRTDGVLSTKAMMAKHAKALGLLSIHRVFLVDSFSYHSLPKQVGISGADAVEILPGCMPKVISWVREDTDLPIIAGGLVCDKEDVMSALGAGAMAIASSNRDVWSM
ncbi:glycerol-3-phosphate responsive antiterminator [Leucobacter insecticola]|uniref:Glycerol-3-phosphate responsive antiterminator n=1 Tax=Leucobacter insecticola TaxID=2714934 RepID=A0A6G8FI48_9MICO|nr:glycerol-3-phosphate responsive antiterminator [Leucobacter insecticola]QIM16166.1 glycerol-3-phosphate responsive antiterminator [Leucobacter insecticola]